MTTGQQSTTTDGGEWAETEAETGTRQEQMRVQTRKKKNNRALQDNAVRKEGARCMMLSEQSCFRMLDNNQSLLNFSQTLFQVFLLFTTGVTFLEQLSVPYAIIFLV